MTFHMPPEWAPQDWLWIGFPHDGEEWPGYLARAQEQIAAFANAVAESGQEVRLLVRDEANEARASELVSEAVRLERRTYGDIWLRDTGPLVLTDGHTRIGQRFGFNGWGGKYEMPGDTTIGTEIARDAGLPVKTADWILEGGAIDGDGTGLVATTEQCLLNPNRNPKLTRSDIENRLKADLGFDRVLWLGDGLINDHTDGHVDNLARFVGPNTLAVPMATGPDDPNAAIYADAEARILDAGLTLHKIRPHIKGEFDDTALMKAFGQQGVGIFPAPEVIAEEICQQNAVEKVAVCSEIKCRYYAISAQRKLSHPAVLAISESAQNTLFKKKTD